uniref:CSON009647 protein n=1 Tax=Culicoides sonorensis TaxID=179676 RepID=A0A336KHX9_CULSO
MISKTVKLSGKMTKNEKITNIENTCRVCGNRGSYSVFQMIPGYLHETEREFLNWEKPINHYLTFILNQEIKPNDGYPQKMCTLCISYMKHAYNFKIQAFRNLGLMAMKNVNSQQSNASNSISVGAAQDIESLNRVESVQEIDRLINESIADDQTGDDIPERVEDENGPDEDEGDKTLTGIFSYAHTSFEEDDITQLEVFQSSQISFYLPETFKERKCMSCRRRFMFEDSYNEHIKDCISLKLVTFIKELTQLLYLRENRAVSSHEFIRRVIFSIKKSVQTVVEYDEGIKKEIEKLNQKSEAIIQKKSAVVDVKEKRKESGTMTPEQFLAKLNVKDVFSQSPSESDNLTNTSNTSSPVPNIFMRCPDCSITFNNLSDLEMHNFQYHNSSSATKTGTGSRSKLSKISQQNLHGTDESSGAEMKNNLIRIRKETKPNYARNLNLTQYPSTNSNMLKTLNKNQNIDVIKNNLLYCDTNNKTHQSTPNQNVIDTSDGGGGGGRGDDLNDSFRTVKCSKCDKRFLTIGHLDLHVAKTHTRSPIQGEKNENYDESNYLEKKSRKTLRYNAQITKHSKYY